MADRFMRLLVFFDLPVNTKKRRREYARFRKALIQDGYGLVPVSQLILDGNYTIDHTGRQFPA